MIKSLIIEEESDITLTRVISFSLHFKLMAVVHLMAYISLSSFLLNPTSISTVQYLLGLYSWIKIGSIENLELSGVEFVITSFMGRIFTKRN